MFDFILHPVDLLRLLVLLAVYHLLYELGRLLHISLALFLQSSKLLFVIGKVIGCLLTCPLSLLYLLLELFAVGFATDESLLVDCQL